MTQPDVRSSLAGMSIGAVLDLLRGDFPDVTISKIRFLEAEGLVTPERTASGYRQADLIAQIAGPVVKAGKAGARDRADDLAREVATLAITLHTSLIKSAVSDVLDR